MASAPLEAMAVITLGDEAAAKLGAAADRLMLRRAWPRSDSGLILEFIDARGQLVAGQWMADHADLRRIAGKTRAAGPESPAFIHDIGAARILLQGRGADRRLRALPPLVARPGARLVSHRAERRAVVRLQEAERTLFAKVMRPERIGDIVDLARHLWDLPDRAFSVPKVVESDAGRGVVIWSALRGQSIHDLAGRDDILRAFASAGHALRWLHQAPAPSAARQHDARAEIEVLRRWIRRLETLRTKTSRDVRRSAGAVMRALRAGDSPAGFLHRDFHDKQVFLERDGRAGFLDFDAAAVGERALDVANMLVHLELRTIQGLWTARIAVDAGSAFLDGYAPTDPVRSRLLAYADATRLRLACLYAFRPPWPEVSDALLGRIGSGLWSRI